MVALLLLAFGHVLDGSVSVLSIINYFVRTGGQDRNIPGGPNLVSLS